MTLIQLQQQIVSEAVAKFREKFFYYDSLLQAHKEQGKNECMRIESFLTSTLHHATQRVAEETAKAIEDGPIGYGYSTEKAASQWLNLNSEDVPEELEPCTEPNTIDRNDLAT